MSSGNSPQEAILIVGVSSREEINAQEESHLDTKYGSGGWVLTARSALTYQGRSLEQVDVNVDEGDKAEVYFDITAVAADEEGDTRGIWDDNDQKPGG